MPKSKRASEAERGKLRIGDDWNAITIIALSQSNPLKAVAEFVENSIDAQARHVTITRGREHGAHYLRITDDGDGIPRDEHGAPNFKYVATHICDSIKRRLKHEGITGLQGEFGIGLLSFWTVGEELTLTCAGADGKTHQMTMRKGDPGYAVTQRRTLFAQHGTDLLIRPLLAGIRQLSGEKIQWYLASELRDRIRHSGVKIKVVDRQARQEYKVEPRQFSGRLLHQLPAAATSVGDVYLELYLVEPGQENRVGLYRAGTRVLADIAELEAFRRPPWSGGYLQGIVDAPFLNLTPGTRLGVIHDERYAAFCAALTDTEQALMGQIEAQRQAEEEQACAQMLRSLQKAFREALLALPAEEYDWFDIHTHGSKRPGRHDGEEIAGLAVEAEGAPEPTRQKQFFEFAGPLYSARIAPATCVVPVGESRGFRAVPRDKSRHLVEHNLTFRWEIAEGGGRLENTEGEVATFHAPPEPALVRLRLRVTQGDIACEAEAVVTVTDSLLPEAAAPRETAATRHGLPGYTFQRAPGELWRSRYDAEQNVIVVNNAHRDFVYAARAKALKLRYISRLYAKELVLKNFPGLAPEQLLERMIELSLYTDENLK